MNKKIVIIAYVISFILVTWVFFSFLEINAGHFTNEVTSSYNFFECLLNVRHLLYG